MKLRSLEKYFKLILSAFTKLTVTESLLAQFPTLVVSVRPYFFPHPGNTAAKRPRKSKG